MHTYVEGCKDKRKSHVQREKRHERNEDRDITEKERCRKQEGKEEGEKRNNGKGRKYNLKYNL